MPSGEELALSANSGTASCSCTGILVVSTPVPNAAWAAFATGGKMIT